MPPRSVTSRSQPTRDRILDAARALFATHGYEGTTLRDVALQAGANVALVIRYYESKEALFAQAASFELKLPDLAALNPQAMGEQLVSHFLSIWEDEATGRQLVALLKAAVSHAAAKARMQEIFQSQLLAAVQTLGCKPPEAKTRAALIASQMLGLALVRYVLELPSASLDRPTTIRVLGRTVQRYLTEPL